MTQGGKGEQIEMHNRTTVSFRKKQLLFFFFSGRGGRNSYFFKRTFSTRRKAEGQVPFFYQFQCFVRNRQGSLNLSLQIRISLLGLITQTTNFRSKILFHSIIALCTSTFGLMLLLITLTAQATKVDFSFIQTLCL